MPRTQSLSLSFIIQWPPYLSGSLVDCGADTEFSLNQFHSWWGVSLFYLFCFTLSVLVNVCLFFFRHSPVIFSVKLPEGAFGKAMIATFTERLDPVEASGQTVTEAASRQRSQDHHLDASRVANTISQQPAGEQESQKHRCVEQSQVKPCFQAPTISMWFFFAHNCLTHVYKKKNKKLKDTRECTRRWIEWTALKSGKLPPLFYFFFLFFLFFLHPSIYFFFRFSRQSSARSRHRP
jgi:hypothetical protein